MNTGMKVVNSKLYQYPCKDSTTCNSIEIELTKGTWRIECWGASGGDTYNSYIEFTYPGGKGGYSMGEIILNKKTKLFLIIGGQGLSNQSEYMKTCSGGYNGGGDGFNGGYINGNNKPLTYTGASGGGGTDVRIGGNNIINRIMVAGGGGGSSCGVDDYKEYGFGGAGGGLEGIDGVQLRSGRSETKGKGGTQNSGGTAAKSSGGSSEAGQLWKGGNSGTGTRSSAGGGGGGYYGGSGGAAAGGGGGSGYVSSIFSFGFTINGENSFPSTSDKNETGHVGNGAIRITCLAKPSSSRKNNKRFKTFVIIDRS